MTYRLGFDGDDIKLLVERLEEAEANLAAALAGNVDAVIRSEGQSFLLKEAQQALLRSEAVAQDQAALLGVIFEHAPDLILYAESDRRIRYANRPPPGFTLAEVLNQDWLMCLLPGEREAIGRLFATVVATGEGASSEGPGLGPGGANACYSRRLGPVSRDGLVVGVVIVVRDISQQKAAEEQLMVSDRMATVGTLAAGVAHEINNPLAAVIANLDVAAVDIKAIAEQAAIPPQLLEEITDARSAADRVRLIVRDLKIFSRSEEDTLQAVDVERVLETTLRMAWNEIRHRAHLVKDYGRVPLVNANESKLGQVFLNLVVNAAQAIPEGHSEQNLIRIATTLESEGKVLITVSDTGPGIPADVQQHLFTPFFTTKPVGEGTGLGLSICHRIITSFGGEISFESELGKGTEFRVVLRVAESVAVVPAAEDTSTPAASGRRGRVLMVDDDAMVRTATRRMLSARHDVLLVDGARRALEMFRRGERFDVVLCDLMMPQMTGMDLYAEVMKFAPAQGKQFVFMTGGAFTSRAKAFLDSVGNVCVEKPIDLQAMNALVSRMVG